MSAKDYWTWGTKESELERQDGEMAKEGMLEVDIMGNERLIWDVG